MNALTSFDQLRPDDEHLDTETRERIWSEIVAAATDGVTTHAAPTVAGHTDYDFSEPLIIVTANKQPSRRRFVLAAVAAALLLVFGGLVAIQKNHGSPSVRPVAGPTSDQVAQPDVTTGDPVPTSAVLTADRASAIALVLPTLPDGLALVGANPPTERLEPSTYQDRLYGSLDDPTDPARMISVEYAGSRGIAIACHSFTSLATADGGGAIAYTASQWMDAATPINGSTPFAVGGATGSLCTDPNGVLQAGWFAGEIGVNLTAGTGITPTELVEFAQSLKQVAPVESLPSRPPVDLVSEPLPAGWTVLVGEDVPFTRHVTETSWVAGIGGDAARQLNVQSWIGAGEQGVYAKHAPIDAERITIRGHDAYRYVSARRGANGPLEIQIWWTEAPGLVISVWTTDLFDVDELTTMIEQMTLADAAAYAAFTG